MVGAGVLVQPLLGLPHWAGVVLVGAVVIFIVVTAGMVSTTWVQFIKGSLLVVFSAVLTVLILDRGFEATPSLPPAANGRQAARRRRCSSTGCRAGTGEGEGQLAPVGIVSRLPGGVDADRPARPARVLQHRSSRARSCSGRPARRRTIADGTTVTTFYAQADARQPGAAARRAARRSPASAATSSFDKLNFLSLMLALFCGTASLPHILIRYYTVKDEAAARKSTIVGIACIGFFYVLTLYMGLGAMTSGALDVTDSNMAAPLLARSFSELLFAIISAIAFTTVLGTVSGLILAAAGAVAHDLLESVGGVHLTDHERVRIAKIAAVVVGVVAIVLGILFKELNVSYLVGWAFSVAASANLPALVMLLFWPRHDAAGHHRRGHRRHGQLAGLDPAQRRNVRQRLRPAGRPTSPMPFSQPGIVTIPLGFATLIVVSLLTSRKSSATP